MKNQLQINQLSPEAFAWYEAYLRSIDEGDLEAYGQFLAPDCEFQFGNQPPVVGRDAILAGLKEFWKGYNGEEHVLLNILGDDSCFALEALNVFHRHDGQDVTIPAVAITRRNEAGLVESFRVFLDITPLYA